MRPLVAWLCCLAALIVPAAAGAAATVRGPAPTTQLSTVRVAKRLPELGSDGHRYVLWRGAGATHRLWDERTGRIATVRTRCHRLVATGAGGQFLLGCRPGTYDVVDAATRRVHRLARIRGVFSDEVAVGRHWVEAVVYLDDDGSDSGSPGQVIRGVAWHAKRPRAVDLTNDGCGVVADRRGRVVPGYPRCPVDAGQAFEGGWLMEDNSWAGRGDEVLTVQRGSHRPTALDRRCLEGLCRAQLGAGLVSWRNVGPAARTTAVRVVDLRRPGTHRTWVVRGAEPSRVVQAHTAHHLLLVVPGRGARDRVLVARLR